MDKITLLILGILTFTSCTITHVKPEKNACYVMYDAGSSGTRLYVYEQSGDQLIAHKGPEVMALADPVRYLHGKTPTDIDTITDQVVATLDLIRSDGSSNKGKSKWTGFDWKRQCKLVSAKVYATAGMRISEQDNATDSVVLWQNLHAKLAAKVGPDVIVETRTLSGYEEGLFAWLSAKGDNSANNSANNFGIVEMGGASSQITFPCADCDPADDGVNMINLDDKPIQMYSYSFLGLGQDEAPHSLSPSFVAGIAGTVPANCAYGVGTTQTDWTEAKCADDILLTTPESGAEIRDPYNYSATGIKGTTNTLPASHTNIPKWSLTGAFNYTKDTDINDCCSNKSGLCYKPQTACFTPIYLKKYLHTLNILPAQTTKNNVSWTLGAVMCETQGCLADIVTKPVCRWTATGCLVH